MIPIVEKYIHAKYKQCAESHGHKVCDVDDAREVLRSLLPPVTKEELDEEVTKTLSLIMENPENSAESINEDCFVKAIAQNSYWRAAGSLVVKELMYFDALHSYYRTWHRLAVVLETDRGDERCGKGRPLPADGAHRSPVPYRRFSPGPSLRRRPASLRAPVLYQLGQSPIHPGGGSGERGLRRVRRSIRPQGVRSLCPDPAGGSRPGTSGPWQHPAVSSPTGPGQRESLSAWGKRGFPRVRILGTGIAAPKSHLEKWGDFACSTG